MRDLYIAEDTTEWLTSSLGSIKSSCLAKLILFYCTYDMEDMTTPGAAALALSTVDQAIVELKQSTGSSRLRVEAVAMTVKGEERRIEEETREEE